MRALITPAVALLVLDRTIGARLEAAGFDATLAAP
jgi:hypothetical protein